MYGLFLVNDMQKPPPPPPSKRAVFIFWSKMTGNILKRMQNQFCNFCNFYNLRYNRSKTEKKCISLSKTIQKISAIFGNGFSTSWLFFCAMFSFWDMVDFVFYLRNALLGELHPPKPTSRGFRGRPKGLEVGSPTSLISIWIRYAKFTYIFFS